MTVEEIRSVLHRAATVRMPRLTPDMPAGQRVEALEDYLNLTAVSRAELHEARLHASLAVHELVDQWDTIEGWEIHLRRRRDPTQADVKAAKREIRPDLYDGIRDGRWLLDELRDQIHRLEIDDRAASRLYTLITGS